jgi:hypothetical protein
MTIDLRTGVPEDEIAAEYEREAEFIERQAWRDICGFGLITGAGSELDRAKRLRAEAVSRRRR